MTADKEAGLKRYFLNSALVIFTTIPPRYQGLKGSDLCCPICGTGAMDVAPDYPVSIDTRDAMPEVEKTIMWMCKNRHPNATNTRAREP